MTIMMTKFDIFCSQLSLPGREERGRGRRLWRHVRLSPLSMLLRLIPRQDWMLRFCNSRLPRNRPWFVLLAIYVHLLSGTLYLLTRSELKQDNVPVRFFVVLTARLLQFPCVGLLYVGLWLQRHAFLVPFTLAQVGEERVEQVLLVDAGLFRGYQHVGDARQGDGGAWCRVS